MDGTGTATLGTDRVATRVSPRPRSRPVPRPRLHARRVVAAAVLLLVAFAGIDVLNLTQDLEWLDVTHGPHMAAVAHAKATPAVAPHRRAAPTRHALLPRPALVAVVLTLFGLVALPRTPDLPHRRTWQARLRGPPRPVLVGARP